MTGLAAVPAAVAVELMTAQGRSDLARLIGRGRAGLHAIPGRGWMVTGKDGDELWIYELVGRGLIDPAAVALLDELARRAGCGRIACYPDSPAHRRMYRRIGFADAEKGELHRTVP